MKRLASGLLCIMLGTGWAVSPQGPAGATELTEKGKAGVAQLAECLQTSSSLEIVYVIDTSGSLKKTDPKGVRAKILKDDLERWAEIARSRDALNITYSAIAYTNHSETLVKRTVLKEDEIAASKQANSLKKKILDRKPDGWTNWGAGLSAASNLLQGSGADCKTIVWFTDGGLNVSGNNKTENFDAIENLCGTVVSGSSLPSLPGSAGLMQRLRNDQVHVFGISLNDPDHPEKSTDKKWDAAYWRGFMQSIAEGDGSSIARSKRDGSLPSGEFVCGLNDSVDGSEYAHGAFLEARSAAEVALAFLNLSAVAQNGTVKACDADGKFWVDPGIGSVQIINRDYGINPKSEWSIADSEGNVVATSNDDGNPVGSSKRLAVNVSEPEQWTVSGVDCDVAAFPELHPTLDPKTVFSGKSAELTGTFVRDGQVGDARIDLFKKRHIKVTANGATLGENEVNLEPKSGAFKIRIADPKADGLLLNFGLDLETSHWVFDTLAFEVSKEVTDASVLPTVEPFAADGSLNSAAEQLAIFTTVTPPAAGGDGTVCFDSPDQIRVVTDDQHEIGASQSRVDTWHFEWSALDNNNCLVVSETTGPVKVALGVSNSMPRNSSVTAVVDYTLRATDVEFPDSQAIDFETFKQHDWTKFALIFALVFLGGVLLPLLMLYLINLATVKLLRGNNLMHGIFPVDYSLEDGSIVSATERPLNVGKIGLEDFKFLPPSSNTRNTEVPGLGALSAVVPLNPLAEPWFEIKANPGTRVFNAMDPRRTSPKEFYSGHKALFSGDVGNFWALSFSEQSISDAPKSDMTLPAKLHVFMRNANPNYTETLIGLLAQPRFNKRVVDAIKMHATAATPKGGNGGSAIKSTSNRLEDPPRPVLKPRQVDPPQPGAKPVTPSISKTPGSTNTPGPTISLPSHKPNPGGATPPPPPPPPPPATR